MTEFDFKTTEEKIKKFWEKEKIYKFNPESKKEIFSIDTPPPYISGKMHIGHAFSYSQQDFVVRFMRMKGKNIFYPFGTDDNGLPTERLVEKINNIKSKNLSRTEFIELCLKTLKKITPAFVQNWKDIGMSCDYESYYSTIDKHSQKISQSSFIELFKKKEIYKKNFPTIWCPECQTSIAQAELEDKEQESLFLTLRFKCDGKNLLIATTRPELLGACVAVFVNPKDKRYKNVVGKKAKVPIFDFEVPIIEDESAEIEKGTGVLMICSYGDRFDVDAINRHKLKSRIILNESGTLNLYEYSGLKIKDARKKILEDLKTNGLIKEQKQIKHSVNVHDKCGNEIEFIETEQWFTKILDKKNELISQAKKINWRPELMFKRYENWVKGLEWDWGISRNRHFGVPIPVWECPKCKEIILPEEKELPVDPLQLKKKCKKCNTDAIPEKMVLDTWATSSLTPQIAEQLSQSKNKIKIPYSLRPQGHDIIRTWAFYTIVKSYLHNKEIPWKNIMISGNVSMGGEKMSKSKGNVGSPQDVMKIYGSDALRFWAAGSKLGSDLDYQEKDLIAGKKLINKLLNASKFVFMNLADFDFEKPKKFEKLDDIFLGELNELIKSSTKNFESFEYSKVKSDVEKFFWEEFAGNYLEIVKGRIYRGQGDAKKSAQYVLYKSFLEILKMFAPFMPFITEKIYQEYFKKSDHEKSIHISSWPVAGNETPFEYRKQSPSSVPSSMFSVIPKSKESEGLGNNWKIFTEILAKVRQEKSLAKKPMNSEIILTIDKKDFEKIKEMLNDLKAVTNSKEIKVGKFEVGFL